MNQFKSFATFALIFCFVYSLPALSQQKKTSKPSSTKSAPTKSAKPRADSAQAIHQSAIIIDTHADTPQRFLDENFDIGQNTPVSEGHIDLGKIKQGNLGAEFFSIWVEPEYKGHYAKRAMDLIDSVYV